MSTERTKCGRLDGDTKPNNVVRAAINHHLPLRPRHRLALGQQQHRCQSRLRPRRLTEQLHACQRSRKTAPAINIGNTTAGDANGDGIINTQDHSAILNQILGTPASNDADCNQDGQVNVQDLVCINIKINPSLQTSASTTHYAYDEQGQLIGEYDQNGTPIQETIYLGNLPVAVIKQGNVYRLYADHLNTPRAIADTTNKVVWRWQSDAFGTTAANEDADGDGTQFNYNLRFPGQYLDQETGLHYNYFRDYNPHTGRYVQSDPIGLAGGLNTYIYVGNNPLYWIDPLGLAVAVPMPAPVVIPGFRLPSPNPWWMIIYPKPAGEGADIVPPGPYYNEDAQAPGCPTEADGFKPKKNWNGEKVKNPNGPGYGWPDNKGNVWVPTGPGSSAHGGPHWDVQIPGRANDYINIYPGGKTRPGRR